MWIAILFVSFLFSTRAQTATRTSPIMSPPTNSPTTPIVLARCDATTDQSANEDGVIINCSSKLAGQECTLSCEDPDMQIIPDNITITCNANQRDHSRLSGELGDLKCENRGDDEEEDDTKFLPDSCHNRCDNRQLSLFHHMMDSIAIPEGGIPLVLSNDPFSLGANNPFFQPQEASLFSHLPLGRGPTGLSTAQLRPIFSQSRLPEPIIYSQNELPFSAYGVQPPHGPSPFQPWPYPAYPAYPAMQEQFLEDPDPVLGSMIGVAKGQLNWPNVLDISDRVLRLVRSRYTTNIGGCSCDPECVVFSDCCSDFVSKCILDQ